MFGQWTRGIALVGLITSKPKKKKKNPDNLKQETNKSLTSLNPR